LLDVLSSAEYNLAIAFAVGGYEMNAEMERLKEATLRVLDELPRDRVAEVLDFALFVRQREEGKSGMARDWVVPSVSATQLDGLVALVAWGGDALTDTERLYDGNG
jgi:hypothetical protein